jgi:Lysophospholipase
MRKWIIVPIVVMLAIVAVILIDQSGERTIKVKGGTLYASLLTPSPDSKKSLAIIVAGSGPTDRDGNTPLLNGKNDSLKALAYALKDNGIASFRYDKRTSGKSVKTMKDIPAEFNLFVDDLAACIRYLKQNENYERIYLVGHSKGCLVALLAAQQEGVDGVISIAGAARPIDEVMAEQYGRIDSSLEKQVRDEIKAIKAGRESVLENEDLKKAFTEENRRFLRTWLVYDPALEAAKLNIPLYFIYGTSDSQVKPYEIQYFGDMINDKNSKIISQMNHVLKVTPEDDKKEDKKRYSDPSYPLHPELISTIVRFME